MTCAACHTGQIEYQKDGVAHTLRIDGAPASADFQRFLTDLTADLRRIRREAFAELKESNSFAAIGKIDAHRQWGKDLEPYVVSGSAVWNIYRVL